MFKGPPTRIEETHLSQGRLGNCWFVSAVESFSQTIALGIADIHPVNYFASYFSLKYFLGVTVPALYYI